jgi:MoaA/NifB/PqqE/SkfB family radical SAM enzyme
MKLLSLLRTARMFLRVAGRLPPDHLWYLARRMGDERPYRFGGQTRINSFFPPHPSPAFDRFCEAVVARRRVPYSTYLAVTSRCPCRCAHCSHAGRPEAELDTAGALALIAQIKALGTCTLGLTGGEPLLRADLEALLAAAGPEMATIVFTTGHGLDAARARSLAESKLGCVTIGVEAADAEAHDAVRGCPGSFDEARAAAAACRAAGLHLALSTVGTRERIASGELERIRLLAARWGASELRVLTPVATGGFAGRPEAMLDEAERAELVRFHLQGNRRSDGPAIACAAHLESPELFGCGAGFHHLFVDSAGKVCPCDLTPLSFGDATEEPLAAIWARMERFFPLPRRACLMARLASELKAGEPLPLCRERSEALCPPRPAGEPLPEGFRRLSKNR